MKIKPLIVILIFLSMTWSVCYSQDRAAVWFDGDGVYRPDGFKEYIQGVLSGIIDDPGMLKMIRQIYPEGTAFPEDRLVQLADLSLNDTSPVTLVIAENKFLKQQHKNLRSQFRKNEKAGKTGSLQIQGFGIRSQGSVQIFEGHENNYVMAVPADPKIIAQLPVLSDSAVEQVKAVFNSALHKGPWKSLAFKKDLDPLGRLIQDSMPAGPWLIWVNQRNMLTFLYYVHVLPGQTTELKCEKVFKYGFFKPARNEQDSSGG